MKGKADLISKFAVQSFLRRKLDDWSWLKSCSESELDHALDSLNLKPQFHTKPFLHQKAAFYLGIHIPSIVFLLEMGLGKTKIVLDILAYRRLRGEKVRALILVPNLANLGTWVEEARIHRPDFPVVALEGSSTDRWEQLNDSGDSVSGFCVNYQGLLAMDKNGDLTNLSKAVTAVVFDESTSLKNWRSKTFKLCNWLSSQCSLRYALTGTPHGRDPQDLWSQFHAVDKGDTLGRTLGIFRAAYFKENIDWFGHYTYTLIPQMAPHLNRTLCHRSIRYRAEECLGLANETRQVIRLEFPKESLAYYQRVKKELRAKLKQSHDVMEIKNSFIRARMITSGFLAVKTEDERVEIEFELNPKLDALCGLIRAMPVDKQMIVYHDFIHTGALIERMCKEEEVSCLRMYGATKDKVGTIQAFKQGQTRVLIMNSQSGSKGLNLQVADYMVFFESPLSSIERQQAEKRIRPELIKRPVFYYDLVIRNSVDESILKFIQQGKSLLDSLLRDRSSSAESLVAQVFGGGPSD